MVAGFQLKFAQAGFGMTAPDPRWHPRNLTMFDIGREAQSDNEGIEPRIAHAIGNMLQVIAGGCQLGLCKVRISLEQMALCRPFLPQPQTLIKQDTIGRLRLYLLPTRNGDAILE